MEHTPKYIVKPIWWRWFESDKNWHQMAGYMGGDDGQDFLAACGLLVKTGYGFPKVQLEEPPFYCEDCYRFWLMLKLGE